MTAQSALDDTTASDKFENIIELIEDSEHMNKSEFLEKAFFQKMHKWWRLTTLNSSRSGR